MLAVQEDSSLNSGIHLKQGTAVRTGNHSTRGGGGVQNQVEPKSLLASQQS